MDVGQPGVGPGIVKKIAHLDMGGLFDGTPVDFAFDTLNDCVWLAEPEAVHRMGRDGLWYRFGYQQGAPVRNVTSVTVVNGVVWVGSAFGLSRLNGNTDPSQLDAPVPSTDSARPDPWRWMHFRGPRWVPSDAVLALVPAIHGTSVDNSSVLPAEASIWVINAATGGITQLNVQAWTLAEKAAAMYQFQFPQFDQYGLTKAVDLDAFGDRSQFHYSTDDNAGLWTSMHAMGVAYKYLATQDPQALTDLWTSFEGLERLNLYSGNYPHYPARCICVPNTDVNNCPTSHAQDPNWFASLSLFECFHLVVLVSDASDNNRTISVVNS
jgi:hypothetical protein